MDSLLNELAFQKVLLSSIDDTVQNREAAEEEVRAEIRSLEKQIRVLKRRTTTTTASNSQSSASSQPSQTQSSNPGKASNTATRDGLSTASAMDGYLSELPCPSHLKCAQPPV
jgi:phage shock protein A